MSVHLKIKNSKCETRIMIIDSQTLDEKKNFKTQNKLGNIEIIINAKYV